MIIFQCMSLTRSEYSKLGLELVSSKENRSRTPKKPSMVEENKNDGADDPISLLLQRDEMMENFSHILQCMPIASGTSSSSGHFGGTSPFKVFAPNSSLGEQIKGAYMPSWVLLSMTAVEERVRKRTTKL